MDVMVRHLLAWLAESVLYVVAVLALVIAVGLAVSVIGLPAAPFVALFAMLLFGLARKIAHADRAARG
ncbi:hypothetical protein [Phaeacidiphilus oryzae]|uniref:hypothetical protein n=1 Tax=Phaeacidiphilus oryzae TaxID=348818 RepID=UPI00055FB2DC|nr:hypothetical protein [Phaeacidiphilus oryzae]